MHYRYSQPQYGEAYGYLSGLNPSMKLHLRQLAQDAAELVNLDAGDLVIDIGGNDGTLLAALTPLCSKLLIDPVAKSHNFWEDVRTLPHFFNRQVVRNITDRRAKLVFSVAMFYDLDDPVDFAKDVASVLADDGVWVLEQSYLPSMLAQTAFDTICHEHLEYYNFTALDHIMRQAGLTVLDTSLNASNGGSIRLIVGKSGNRNVNGEIAECESNGMSDMDLAFQRFVERVNWRGEQLKEILEPGYAAYGASTKGNTLLQYYGLKPDYAVDINPDKWGCVTPGTKVPIIGPHEDDGAAQYLVLPWHFRDFILHKERNGLLQNAEMIFPLPEVRRYGLGQLDKRLDAPSVGEESAVENT
jgi:hypothetical protein